MQNEKFITKGSDVSWFREVFGLTRKELSESIGVSYWRLTLAETRNWDIEIGTPMLESICQYLANYYKTHAHEFDQKEKRFVQYWFSNCLMERASPTEISLNSALFLDDIISVIRRKVKYSSKKIKELSEMSYMHRNTMSNVLNNKRVDLSLNQLSSILGAAELIGKISIS